MSILSCFVPPEGYHGDFGWLCGFTANADVLAAMAENFTAGSRRRRPSLELFLHPPETALRQNPDIMAPYFSAKKPRPFHLLHAKVALLHFRGRRGSLLRLIVSTGNWTHDPMSTSLDLYWIVEWQAGLEDDQVAADIRASAAMFEWLRPLFDTSAMDRDVGARDAVARLRAAIELLPAKSGATSRFMDTRARALQPQLLEAVSARPARRSRLIMGSGYFETGEAAEAGVLTGFVDELVSCNAATGNPTVDLVINPESCQGLAAQAAALAKRQWSIRPPKGRPEMPGAKLHAKFAFGAGGSVNCTNAWCYIGSGNLSRIGFTRDARNGNLEAGVLFFPENLTWGDGDTGIAAHLPVDLDALVKPDELTEGDDYASPPAPAMPPPVGYLWWRDGWLTLPEGAPDDLGLLVEASDGSWTELPAAVAAPPPFALIAPMMAQVPVLTDQGFVLPPPVPKRVEDVLHELAAFPDLIPADRDGTIPGDVAGEQDVPVPLSAGGEYPVRRMMRLIVRLTERQASVETIDWERWTNRLHDALIALHEPEAEMIDGFRSYGIDPLDALLHPAFAPPGLSPEQFARLQAVVSSVRSRWNLEGLTSILPEQAR